MWELILRGRGCGAGQVKETPGPSTALMEHGEGQQQHPGEVRTGFRAFYPLLWSMGAWLRAVEDTDQVGKAELCVVKLNRLCVSCSRADVVVGFWACAASAASRFPQGRREGCPGPEDHGHPTLSKGSLWGGLWGPGHSIEFSVQQ